MRIIFTLCIIYLFTCKTASGQWIQSENLVGGSMIYDMIEYKGSIYATIVRYGVFRSDDNGESWYQVVFAKSWASMYFSLHNDKLLACTVNTFYKTEDGKNWEEEVAPSSNVNKIASNGSMIAIATYDGVFLSEDEGRNWINSLETSSEIFSIAFEGSTIWAGGADGTIWKSNDQGENWNKSQLGVTSMVDDIIITEDQIYLGVGNDGVLLSSDNGENWRNIANSENPLYFVRDIDIKDDKIIILANTLIFTSADKGESWERKGEDANRYYFSNVLVTDEYTFLGSQGGGIFRNTSLEEDLWKNVSSGLKFIETHDILVEDTLILVATSESFIHSSKDEGNTWTQLYNQYGYATLSASSLVKTSKFLYAGLYNEGIYRSEDYGNSWEKVNDGLNSLYVEQLSANDEFVFAATDEKLYRCEVGGSHWQEVSSGITSGLRTVETQSKYVFAGTWDGLYVSENNGDSWTKISTSLPDESINDILCMDTVLIVSTQNGGIHKTANLGDKWSKISDEYGYKLAERKGYLFIGSWQGKLWISSNLGESWVDLGEQLPIAIVNAIDFTENEIIVGTNQPGHGIWKRALHEIVPPNISFSSACGCSSSFLIGEPIHITADQIINKEDGSSLDVLDLQSLISVQNQQQENVSFTAQIDSSERVIEVYIENPLEGEQYFITVATLYNLSGLSSEITESTAFRAKNNVSPVIEDIELSEEIAAEVKFDGEQFVQAFSDTDGDALVKIIIKTLPEHGSLLLNQEEVEINDEILLEDIAHLSYIPDEGYAGNDQFSWNASDGKDYASHDVKMVFNVSTITSLAVDLEENMGLKIHPNPTSEELHIQLDNNFVGECNIQLIDLSGKEVGHYLFFKKSFEEDFRINLTEFQSGIYFLNISTPEFQLRRKVIIMKE